MVLDASRGKCCGNGLARYPSACRMSRLLGVAAVIKFAQCTALHAEPF